MDDLKKASLKGASWNFVTVIVNQLRNFIVSIILSRLLMPTDFGVIGMAMAFSGMVDAFVDFGFGNAIIQKREVTQEQKSTVFYLNMIMGVAFTLIMFFSSGLIADFFNMPILNLVVKVMSVSFIIKALDSMQASLMRKELDFKTPFKVQLISGIASGIIGITMAYTGFGVWSLIVSQMSGWVMATSLMWMYSSWRPGLQFSMASVKDLWNFGYKYSITIFIDAVFVRLDTVIIGKIFSAATLGLFNRAQALNKLVIQYSFSAFSGVLFPSLSKVQHDIERLRHSVLSVIQVVSFTTFYFSGAMYICAESAILLLYGDKWLGAVPFFKILGIFSFIYTLPMVLVTPIMSLGKTGASLKVEAIKKVLLVIAIPFGIKFGVYSYIYALSIAGVIGMLLNMYLVRVYIGLPIFQQIKQIVLFAFPALCLVVLLTFVSPYITTKILILDLVIRGGLYTILYILWNRLADSEGYKITERIFVDIIKKLKLPFIKFKRQ